MDTNYNPASVSCNIHQAMDTILQLVPTAPSVLMPLLTKNYPFKGRGPDIQSQEWEEMQIAELEDDHSSMHGLFSPQQSAHDYLTGLIYLTLYHHHRLSTFYPRRA
ncbi:uncharacterized protein LOC135350826 isoform X1 [Halichondria panicea]|uniref:uncharacterized protein LOC135350826 isoform X1 n=1 Tax=Halichondria panicea TaxID=6063 RepID=UPI00312BB5A2